MKGLKARVNQEGRLILPPDVASHYGMMPGADVDLEEMGDGLHLRRPVTHLAKVYIEPTSGCNLACRTCIRKSWGEPLGQMRGTTFSLIIKGLSTFSPARTFFSASLESHCLIRTSSRWWFRPKQ